MLGCHGDVVKDSVTSEKPLGSAEKASYTYTLQRRNKLRLLKILIITLMDSQGGSDKCVCVHFSLNCLFVAHLAAV